MLSFWEELEYINYDFIVVGGGITGLSTACEIKEQYPSAKVLVLERGVFSSGASTKNAGFACIGTLSEKAYDLKLMGEEALVKLVYMRWQGLQILRNRLGDKSIDYQNNYGYELVLNSAQTNHLHQLDDINKLFYPVFNQNVFQVNNAKIAAFGFKQNLVQTLIENKLEGQLNTGLLIANLSNYAAKLGVTILTGVEVQSFKSDKQRVQVKTKSLQQNVNFTCNKLAICTNAFTKKLIQDIDIKPGRGQVICTSPIENLKVKGTFNFDEGFYYFRNYQNRIIFGGGRNLDFDTETTDEFGLNDKIINQLKWYLDNLIIPETDYKITHQWAGIMAFGNNKLPLIKLLEPNIAIGVRLNGMGVALGSKIAKELAKLIC